MKGLGALRQTGAVRGPTPGRADAVPADVPEGSYVIPADVVSAAGQGNTDAGYERLSGLFRSRVRRGIPRPRRADGGIVPIAVSHGEMILSPEEVEAAGGPAVLDGLVKTIRDDYRRHLAKLPGPRK
jgi:hypothetical protein